MKLINNWCDFLSIVITLIAAMEYGVEFGLYLLLVGIFLRLGHIEDLGKRLRDELDAQIAAHGRKK